MIRLVPLIGLALALAACAQAPKVDPALTGMTPVSGYQAAREGQSLVIRRAAVPFTYSDGAAAKRAANAICGGKVASSHRDHFRDGAWVFPEGCA